MTKIIADVLEANQLPGAICSTVTGLLLHAPNHPTPPGPLPRCRPAHPPCSLFF